MRSGYGSASRGCRRRRRDHVDGLFDRIVRQGEEKAPETTPTTTTTTTTTAPLTGGSGGADSEKAPRLPPGAAQPVLADRQGTARADGNSRDN